MQTSIPVSSSTSLNTAVKKSSILSLDPPGNIHLPGKLFKFLFLLVSKTLFLLSTTIAADANLINFDSEYSLNFFNCCSLYSVEIDLQGQRGACFNGIEYNLLKQIKSLLLKDLFLEFNLST